MTAIYRALFVASATAAVAGCAHTSMTSLPAPDLRGRSYHSILVVAQIADLGLKLAMEDRFHSVREQQCIQELRGAGIGTGTPQADSAMTACLRIHFQFVPSHSVFFPGRDYSSEQVVAAMRQNGIDAELVITPGEAGSAQSYVPPTYTTRCTSYDIFSGCSQTTTTSSGGSSYSKPWAQFSARLFDAADGQAVWVATATFGGNRFAQTSDLVQSMADKTLERLIADKVIQ